MAVLGIKVHWWMAAVAALALRLALLLAFPGDQLGLSSRPEVATPLTSLRRLAEGYWLKQASMSPYTGSMYHASPLLLSILGPLAQERSDRQNTHIYLSLIFVAVDFVAALLLRAVGEALQSAYIRNIQLLKLTKAVENSSKVSCGDIASLVYLWNPWAIVSCLGHCTSPIENLMVILTLYGACSGLAPLAAFGYVIATHLSLYPVVLIVPVILLLGSGLDAPPSKLFLLKISSSSNASSSGDSDDMGDMMKGDSVRQFLWRPILNFLGFVIFWSFYVLMLSFIALKGTSGLQEMFRKTYGFIITVEDLSPNIGVLWYFFAEVFDFFRNFFLMVFHMNILFVVIPLAIRLRHRPCFLAFVYTAILGMLKSYPSVGDTALYLGLLGLFITELADMQFSFFLFVGYIGVSLLSPVMHNLWIWRGTGNANFYFATGLAYACLQTVLIVESISSMLKYDRKLKKLLSP